MKKTYIQPSANVVAFGVDCSILSASGVENNGETQKIEIVEGDGWAD